VFGWLCSLRFHLITLGAGETIDLIESAIRPLLDAAPDDPQLLGVLSALQQCMDNAKAALEKLAKTTSFSQRVLSWIRSSNYLSELKRHQEKLKTLCPILSLAITAGQQNKKDGDGQGFDALRLLQNYETKNFWAHHFGPKTFKVTWSRFLAAFEHEFGMQDQLNKERLRKRLDRNRDGDVDIYELANFTGSSSLRDSFCKLKQRESQTAAHRPKRTATQVLNEHLPSSDQPRKKSKIDGPEEKKVMGPPLTSLAKVRFNLAPDISHAEEDSNTWDSEWAYKLVLFARDEIFQLRACNDIRILHQQWDQDNPFTLKRAMMEHLPKDLLVRISRSHFEIHCLLSRTTQNPQRQYWIVDTSANGTFLNGKRLTPGNRILLHSGDQIGIVTDKQLLMVEMGYIFQSKPCSGSPKNQVSSSPSLHSASSTVSSISPSTTLDDGDDFPCTPPKSIPTIVVTPPQSPLKEENKPQQTDQVSPVSPAALASALEKLSDNSAED